MLSTKVHHNKVHQLKLSVSLTCRIFINTLHLTSWHLVRGDSSSLTRRQLVLITYNCRQYLAIKKCLTSKEMDESKPKENNEQSKNHNPKEDTYVDYDQLLSAAGEFGLYQIFLFFLMGPFFIFGSFSYFSQLFLTQHSQDYWCWIPELANLTAQQRKELAIPLNKNSKFGYEQCISYDANWAEILSTEQKAYNWSTAPCKHGWEFNNSDIPYETISSEFDWVCDKDNYQAIAQSVFFIGSIFGGFIIGWVADLFGRLPAVMASNCIGCIFGVISTFTKNFTTFTICRFFMGMSYDNCMMMAYLLVLEYIAPKYRTIIINLSFSIFFTIGVCSLPWIAVTCDSWKVTSIATSLPLGLSLLAPFIMSESPRWLLSKGRVDDAIGKVLNIARINKKFIPPNLIIQFKQSTLKMNKDQNTRSMIILFKRPHLRRVFLCMCVLFLCAMVIYDSLIRTIGQLQFNFFVSFTIISFTEFPSLLILSFILDWFGRKWLTIIALMNCGIFSFITPFVADGWPSILCAVVARFGINMSLNACMQWTAEVLPTPVRGSASSVVHICGYIATVISPFVPYLDVFALWLPLVVVGSISIFAGLLCLTLPETANRDMPQTFDDADDLIRSQDMWQIFRKSN